MRLSKIEKLEPVAKLHLGSILRLVRRIRVLPQVAYSQSNMSTCGKTEPTNKSSKSSSKASFATGSLVVFLVLLPVLGCAEGPYRNNLRNWEFEENASQSFCSEQGTTAEKQGVSESKNPEVRPTQSKTNPSSCFDISSKISSIPLQDRETLEAFFKYLVSFDPFAYTIFGDKPIAIGGYKDVSRQISLIKGQRNREILDTPFFRLTPHNLKVFHGFQTWKKYKVLFPMQNYLILECENLIPNGYTCIMIINKKTFLKTVSRHLDDFQQVLGKEMTPLLLLERFQKEKNIFQGVLKNNQMLIGILFGFGKHNARLYQERYDLMHCKSMKLEECPQNLKGFNTSGLALNSLMLELPRFAADPSHPETKQLKHKYLLQRRGILKRYQSGDFLELTLEELCQKTPPIHQLISE